MVRLGLGHDLMELRSRLGKFASHQLCRAEPPETTYPRDKPISDLVGEVAPLLARHRSPREDHRRCIAT